jgi:hypothetical protein
LERYLEQIREELVTCMYQPMRNRRKEIPKENGKVRVLGIPTPKKAEREIALDNCWPRPQLSTPSFRLPPIFLETLVSLSSPF